MNKTIFVTRKIPEIGLELLRNKGYEIDMNPKDSILSQKQLISFLKKKPYDAVLCLLTDKIDAVVFDSAPSVRIYSNYATGYNNIDVNEARKRNIVVTNTPSEMSALAVAEHTIALMLAVATRIVEADSFVRKGKYTGWSPNNFIGTNVSGKTLGLIGAGHIGEKVASYSKSFGLKIIYTDTIRNTRMEIEQGALYYNSVYDLLSKADIVSLHVPLLDSTRHLINESSLKSMRPTSILINTSRGPIIDEIALEKALREKTISGAGLDVFEFEPDLVPGLTKLPNIVLTPHIASASIEAREQMAEMVAQNIISFFETGKAINPAYE